MQNPTIQLRYLQRQDRILANLSMGDAPFRVALTRRLTSRLLKTLAELLEKPAAAAADDAAPANTAPVAERHRDAVSAVRPATPVPVTDATEVEADPAPAGGPALIDQLKVARMGTLYALLIPIRGVEHRLRLSDADLMRFVDMLYRKSVEAGWDLEDTVPWLKDSYFGAEAAVRRSAVN